MEVKLVIASGKQTGKEIPVKSPKLLIGRGEECQLRLQSHLVSRKHCVILREEDSAAIEDLGSTNGTFVNDEKLEQRRELKNGDRIRVGLLTLEVHLPVAVGDKLKPKVQNVQEAAARTAALAGGGDDFDVSRWLAEEDALVSSQPRDKPVLSEETIAGKSLTDTTTIHVPPPHEKKEQEKINKEPLAKTVGKFNRPAKPMADSSGTAADDALRQFFHRKKS